MAPTRSTTTGRTRGANLGPAHTGRAQPTGTGSRKATGATMAGGATDALAIRRAATVALRETGMAQQVIAAKLGVSIGTVRNDLRVGI
ncbi:MAG: hypothetical protein ACYDA6_00040 [Solirubrobacteraceae bacterium]